MRRCFRRSIGASLALAGLAAACTHGSQIKPTPAPRSLGAAVSPAAMAAADRGRPPYTRADVHFMLGMIGHHGQAVVMADRGRPAG
jgi:uncharacterized protein (DUF305 family)